MNQTGNLAAMHCQTIENGTSPFSQQEIQEHLNMLPGWESRNEDAIIRTYKRNNFAEALRFVNEIGKIAEAENHHPDITIHDYKLVTVTLSTHSIGGVSTNDVIMAAKINTLG